MLEQYLREEWYKNNMPKYYKYFEEWFNNLTNNQIFYFTQSKNKHI